MELAANFWELYFEDCDHSNTLSAEHRGGWRAAGCSAVSASGRATGDEAAGRERGLIARRDITLHAVANVTQRCAALRPRAAH
jgi:hypothetical protein